MTEPVETSPPLPLCANCGAPLHGNFCYACGQPVKGLIRHLSGIVGDFLDSVLSLDSRTFRTLTPLFFRPGYLANEYFAGRRVRYVTPLRLFFFMSVIAFFSVQLYLEQSGLSDHALVNDHANGDDFSGATTPAEVQDRLDKALTGLKGAQAAPGLPASAEKAIGKAEAKMRKKADARIAYLKAVDEARAKNLPPPKEPQSDWDSIGFDGEPWDPKTHPIRIEWLPEFGNAKLNQMAGNMKSNILRAKDDPKRLLVGLFGVLPQTLFVLMPFFAVLLKFLYLFKRRLYMEHLIVALQSHAFVFFALLLIAWCGLLGLSVDVLAPTTRVLMILIAWWIPLYLLLMQRRVYRQNWFMTIFKYGLVGICYSVLIGIAIAVAFVLSLTAGA
ncbi:MAG: DUF3667 domain-containing protein [Tahibacter sp.]